MRAQSHNNILFSPPDDPTDVCNRWKMCDLFMFKKSSSLFVEHTHTNKYDKNLSMHDGAHAASISGTERLICGVLANP